MKKIKKRRFKYRLIGYAFIMFLGYQISFNIIMNFKLVSSNESFIKALLVDSNYHMLYEKKANNLFTKGFSKIINVNKPVTILDNIFHLKTSKEESRTMAYVENPNIDTSKVEKEPEIYIYNTHQGETYEGKGLEEYNISPGVMMASYLLQKKLLENSVKSIVMEENLIEYMNLNNMNHAKSYLASRKFLEETLKNNKNLKLIIDIHRDSLPKEKSTVIINNKPCAKILFVIGEEYDTYKENLNITNILNEKIKEKYPELTRGIITKGGKGNNGVYNQDLNSNITLMELGADKNTIEEVSNTINLIGPIIGEYING
ncbi:MAG: stage II sporulation protein P [Bacilli bacterium]|nr:stage II sporulation protein P [Bacilli bacterium]